MDFSKFNYKKANEIAVKTKKFYESNKPGSLVQITNIKGVRQELPPLNSFDFPKDMYKWIDVLVERDIAYANIHKEIDDDFIPSSSPWYGIAEHSAFLGGRVDFTPTTTFPHPICDTIQACKGLRLDTENIWIQMVVGGIKYIREKWGDYIPARMRGANGPSDIANAVRGNNIFYDIYDYPKELDELLKFCVKAVSFALDLQRQEATKILDGCISGFGLWMPGKCMGHISDDLSTMLSPEMYQEYFLPSLEICVDQSDIAMLHTHSLGHKIVPMFATIEKIKLIEISNDPKSPRAVEVFSKYQAELSEKIVIIKPSIDEIIQNKSLLAQSKTIIVYTANSLDEAKRVVEVVKNIHK